MTVEYNPKIVDRYATRLYIRAANIIVAHALMGLFFGGAGGFSLGLLVGAPYLLVWVVGLVGLLVGAGIGSSRDLIVKLEAQQALCQVRIEENLRQIAVYQSEMLQRLDRRTSS